MTEYTRARIRVTREGSEELGVALDRYEDFLLDARDLTSPGDDRKRLNRRITVVRTIHNELERTITEHGWSQETDSGELQRTQP
jgi:hypothetical protein